MKKLTYISLVIIALLLPVITTVRTKAQTGVTFPCAINFDSTPDWVNALKAPITSRGLSITDPNNRIILARLLNGSVSYFFARPTQPVRIIHKDTLNRTILEFTNVPLGQSILQMNMTNAGVYQNTSESSGGNTIYEISEVCGVTSGVTYTYSTPLAGTAFKALFPQTTTNPTITPMTHETVSPPPTTTAEFGTREVQLVSLGLVGLIVYLIVRAFTFRMGSI